MTSSLRKYLEPAALFFGSLLLFTYGLRSQEVIGFESRFYMFALEMWRHGLTWFPTTYGEYYPDYPATSTWLICISALFLGGMSKLAAVFPTAVAASITVLFTYYIGTLRDKRWGLYAVFFLMMTIMFIKSARSISLDMYPAMITTICFYLVYSADQKDMHERESFIYPLWVLGFMFRGPIGLVIPAAVVGIYYLFTSNYKRLFFTGAAAILILFFCLLIMLLMADGLGGDTFVNDVIRMQVVGRLGDSHVSHYFYLLSGLQDYALSFPVAILASVGAIYYERRLHHHSSALRLLLISFGWMAIILLGMSIPGDKKSRYVLAIAPAISLLAAYFFVSPKTERYFSRIRFVLLHLILVLPLALFIVLRLVSSHAAKNVINFNIDYLLMTQILFGAMAVNGLIYVCFEKKREWRDTGILAIGALTFVLCYINIAEPVLQTIDKTREFVTSVEAARIHNKAELVFYHEHRDGMPIKYLINMHQEDKPIFIESEIELTSLSKPAFFVTSKTNFDALSPVVAGRYRIIGQDNIGHVPVIVFTQR